MAGKKGNRYQQGIAVFVFILIFALLHGRLQIRTMGLDSQKYGVTLDEVVENPGKERIFMKLYPEFVRYTIVGDVWDINNWKGEMLQE